MDRFRHRLKTFVWAALLAFVGLAVMPTISRAIRSADELRSHEVISHEEMAAVGSGSAHDHRGHEPQGGGVPPAPVPAEHEHSIDHCAMCVVAGFAFALAARPPAVDVRDVADTHIAAPPGALPRWCDDWSPASSRGPPPIA